MNATSRKYDVVAIGEPIIDFVQLPRSPRGNLVYEAYTGGGASNVLAQVCAFGGKAAIIGAVGRDLFGDFLAEKLGDAGVDTPALHRTGVKNTGIGFVHLAADGERSFTFYRNPEKRIELFAPEDRDILARSRLFHFTSVSLAGPSIRESTLRAARCARELGVGVSFDVNHRPSIWGDAADQEKEVVLSFLRLADIVKISEEERDYLFGDVSNPDCAVRLHAMGARLAAISMGARGCFYSYAGGQGECPSIEVRMVDSTGCGDAFGGALLAQLAALGGVPALDGVQPEAMRDILRRANAAGALCASRFGSFTVMPTADEVDAALRDADSKEGKAR